MCVRILIKSPQIQPLQILMPPQYMSRVLCLSVKKKPNFFFNTCIFIFAY